ncbi:hypothetical protein CLU79DRAFT_731402 [Phycomyces nitens]|nr:hypothetical protein CLU79DRAFT_731402 [Phycomyces nitens]
MKIQINSIVFLSIAVLLSATMVQAGEKKEKVACHTSTEPRAQAVCQDHCDDRGYKVGECGKEGICLCYNYF